MTYAEIMDAMKARMDELEARVAEERDNLSAWRKDEAIYLALDPEERKELARIQSFFNIV